MSIKYGLDFISDDDLFNHVKHTVDNWRFKIDLKKFNKNIIDPIKLTFDSKIYNKSIEDIIETEVLRQIDKSNNNQIGYFHQNIFKYIGGNNWIVPKQGFDLINEDKKIYVEMKNKHNTMNASSSQKTFITMQNKISEHTKNICMLVEIIASKSQNIPWQISLDGTSIQHERIRKISIDKFYEIVTQDNLAFYKLCSVLPKVLDDVLEHIEDNIIENTVLYDLKKLYPSKDLLGQVYLLAFKTYEGFNINKK